MSDHRRLPGRTEFPFWWPVQVRWGDMDALGHVNNCIYLQYLESARVGFFEWLGFPLHGPRAAGRVPVVVSQTFHYRRQVVYPASLEVGVRCAELRTRSFVLEYALFQAEGGPLMGNGTTVLAWVEAAATQAVELPEALRERLADSAGPAPA